MLPFSAVSDHCLITFEVSLACPYVSDTNVFTSRHISPAIIVTLSDKVPGVLAPFVTLAKPVESLTNKVSSVTVSLLDSVARSLPRQDDQSQDLNQACRKMERAWRESKLDVFFILLGMIVY